MRIHPTPKMDETEGFQCLGHSNWTICSPLSPFCSERFASFGLSYWEANSYYPKRANNGKRGYASKSGGAHSFYRRGKAGINLKMNVDETHHFPHFPHSKCSHASSALFAIPSRSYQRRSRGKQKIVADIAATCAAAPTIAVARVPDRKGVLRLSGPSSLSLSDLG